MWGTGYTRTMVEYTIKELSITCKCYFHDGMEKSCFERAIYSLDVIPLCQKHLHIRMRAITWAALASGNGSDITYKIK